MWILIIVLSVSTGMGVGAAEFSSKASCDAAAYDVKVAMGNRRGLELICVEK